MIKHIKKQNYTLVEFNPNHDSNGKKQLHRLSKLKKIPPTMHAYQREEMKLTFFTPWLM